NRTKSRVRSKVEHVFAVMKLKFGFVKLRFRGLKKNATQLFAVCALVNLYLARKKLLLLAPACHGRAAQAGGRPEKTESERLHRPSGTLTTSKTRAYSEFPLLSSHLTWLIKLLTYLRQSADPSLDSRAPKPYSL